MKINLPIWAIALIVIGLILVGYFASMAVERMNAKKDKTVAEPTDTGLTIVADEVPVEAEKVA